MLYCLHVLFKMKTPPIPMKSFNNKQDAKTWLAQFK